MKLFWKVFSIVLVFLVSSFGLKLLGESISIPAEIRIDQLGPALTTMVFAFLIFKENYTLRSLLVQQKHPSYLVIFIFLLPLVLAVIAKTLHIYLNDNYPLITLSNGSYVWLVLVWIPFGALFEELGWRNYLQRLFDEKCTGNPLYAHIVIGLLWSASNFQNYQYGWEFVIGQFLLLTSTSVLLGDILYRRGQNIITATVAHMSINLGIIYMMYTNTYTALTSILYGAIAALFTMYYIFNLKKIYKT